MNIMYKYYDIEDEIAMLISALQPDTERAEILSKEERWLSVLLVRGKRGEQNRRHQREIEMVDDSVQVKG